MSSSGHRHLHPIAMSRNRPANGQLLVHLATADQHR